MDTVPSWMLNVEDEDAVFIKKFVLASGSLKEMAALYGVSYPTMRLGLVLPGLWLLRSVVKLIVWMIQVSSYSSISAMGGGPCLLKISPRCCCWRSMGCVVCASAGRPYSS